MQLISPRLRRLPISLSEGDEFLAAVEEAVAYYQTRRRAGPQRRKSGLSVMVRRGGYCAGSLSFRHGLRLSLAALRGHRVCLRTKRQYRVVGQLHTRWDASGVEHLLLPMLFVG